MWGVYPLLIEFEQVLLFVSQCYPHTLISLILKHERGDCLQNRVYLLKENMFGNLMLIILFLIGL